MFNWRGIRAKINWLLKSGRTFLWHVRISKLKYVCFSNFFKINFDCLISFFCCEETNHKNSTHVGYFTFTWCSLAFSMDRGGGELCISSNLNEWMDEWKWTQSSGRNIAVDDDDNVTKRKIIHTEQKKDFLANYADYVQIFECLTLKSTHFDFSFSHHRVNVSFETERAF